SIWITRPEADAARLVDGLRELGLEPVVAPLFEAHFLDVPQRFEPKVDAVLVTSRNGIRALASAGRVTEMADVALFAVGPGSAEEARQAGFVDVRTGPGQAKALPALVRQTTKGRRWHILYARGEDISVDLAAALTEDGHSVTDPIVYRMEPTPEPADRIAAAIGSGAIEMVTLFSPKASERYLAQMAASGLTSHLQTLIHACLSERVAAPLRRIGVPRIVVAAAPNLEEMLALTGRSAAK
ncbi:MAG: uroporphyrinogen-III synthase, partial [Pseudomonadota bacterium]